MFTIHYILDIISYICTRNVQCWARITKTIIILKIVDYEKGIFTISDFDNRYELRP